MATSAKFDMSSSSPDGSCYLNGQRGSYAASLDRSGSFREREGLDGRLPSSLPGSSRSFSMSSQADMPTVFQSVQADLKLVALDQKFPRQGDLKKIASSVLGVSPDDSSFATFSAKNLPASSTDELKRAKSNIHESFSRARDRSRYFGELASKCDKYFPNNLSKKRSRSDISSNERSNVLMQGVGMTKNMSQVYPSTSGLDSGPQRSEDRIKTAIPNRRIRTSMADTRMEGRPNSIVKPSGPLARDRDTKLVSGNAAVLSEEKTQASSGGGWEKLKMKKRRTGIKLDASENVVMTRPLGGDREVKPGLQQRFVNDAQTKLINAHGFRHNREDNIVSNPSSAINKSNVSARAPRTSIAAPSKASPTVHRVVGSPDDSEISQCMTKLNSGVGASKSRRIATQSSSPPSWGGHRHKNMTRPPRRTNFPHISGHDDVTFPDDTSARNNEGIEPPKHSPNYSGQQIKLKGDHAYSAGLSESEESGIAENKSKDKVKKCSELEEKAGQTLQRVTPPSLLSRKSKPLGEGEEDPGDGSRRLVRPGRGLPPVRPGMPSVNDKLENTVSAKQLKSVKHDSERIESKPGRPPTKKSQERKGDARPRHVMNSSESVELAGEPDDDREELLNAANLALNTRYACSNLFWKQLDPFFRFVSAKGIAFLKQQLEGLDERSANMGDLVDYHQFQKHDLGYSSLLAIPAEAGKDDCKGVPNGVGSSECKREVVLSRETKHVDEPSVNHIVHPHGVHSGISICQLLLSAMIEEDDDEDEEQQQQQTTAYYFKGREEECFSNDVYAVQFASDVDSKDKDMDLLSLESSQRFERIHANGFTSYRYYDEPNYNNLQSNEYNQMCVEDRIFLELNEIGLSPEHVPDLAQSEDEEIGEGIRKLEEKLQQEVTLKKILLGKLEKSVIEAREIQKRQLERIALEKLVVIAYGKYMAIWGPNASGSKNTNKITKHRALSFVKRTLARCQAYVQTGKSCFSEPSFQEIFQSVDNISNEAEFTDTTVDDHSCLTVLPGTKNARHEKYASDTVPVQPSDQTLGKDDLCSNKVKKRELLLNVGIGGLGSGTKGKRSERDRDGKRTGRDAAARSGTSRVGRPALTNAKGERKNKAKSKNKTAQLSASISDLVDETLPSAPRSRDIAVDGNLKHKDGSRSPPASSGVVQDVAYEAMDFSNLQLPDVFGGQTQDLNAWFNFDDEGLQDQDLMGLEIPMDDLSDLNMLV